MPTVSSPSAPLNQVPPTAFPPSSCPGQEPSSQLNSSLCPHTPYPICQQILLVLPLKYIQGPTASHHLQFSCSNPSLRCCSPGSLNSVPTISWLSSTLPHPPTPTTSVYSQHTSLSNLSRISGLNTEGGTAALRSRQPAPPYPSDSLFGQTAPEPHSSIYVDCSQLP